MSAQRTSEAPVATEAPTARGTPLGPGVAVLALVVGFVAISVWWVMLDMRLGIGDSAKHISIAFGYFDRIGDGALLAPLIDFNQYPPLVHLVGVLGSAVGGTTVPAVVLSGNLIFVPLLALGCYGTGTVTFDRRTGALAALFALGTPMVISLFHVFMLDAPAAAMVAMSVWMLLLSDRFRRLGPTLAAAAFVALGFHIKATFVLFVAGLVLVMLLRGGWRNWRNVAVFGALTLALVQPYYLLHFEEVAGLAKGAAQAQEVFWYDDVPYAARWSLENFTWYGWALMNEQLYVPLTLFFAVGLGTLCWSFVRDRRADSLVPELVVGGLVGYLGISLISLDDPRYTLPCLVYVAVIATAWMRLLPRTAQIGAISALAGVVLLNTWMINTGAGTLVRVVPPWAEANPISRGMFKLASNEGYSVGPPYPGSDAFIELLKRARVDGARKVVFDPPSMNNGGYNLYGLSIWARTAGLEVPGFDGVALGPEDVYVYRVGVEAAKRPPCLLSSGSIGGLGDGTGIYMVKGPPKKGKPVYCPPERLKTA